MKQGLTNELMAIRVGKELLDGSYVNLGYGASIALVANFIPEGKEVVFQSENGLLGYGPVAEEGEWDTDMITATGQPMSLLPGASFFHSADSFAMLRGGHIDVTIMGCYQVSEKGDLANWAISEKDVRGMGGAMDLAVGAKRVFIVTEHTTKDGEPKIVKKCTYPLTAAGVVDMIFTDLAVIKVTSGGLLLTEVAPEFTAKEVQEVTEPKLIISRDLKEIEL
jgi:3-oxoacid CoA-transferase B subunit